MNLGTLILIAILAFVISPLFKIVIAALFGRQIGQMALAKQPDTIHLQRLPDTQHGPGKAEMMASEFTSQGFEDAGRYEIPEMPGVKVRLLAAARESMYGAVYEHPAVGVWGDVVSRYTDGSAWSFTSSKPTGLKQKATVRMVNVPGANALTLIERSRKERPGFGLKPASVSAAVGDFERAYAEYMAWMKQRGVTTGEVVDVARRKVA